MRAWFWLVVWIQVGSQARGGRMSEKSSWLSHDAASSSSEDMSTTAGWRDVMCVRKAYAYSPQRGVASCIHLRSSFCRTWAGGFPSTNRVVSQASAEKVVKEGRSSSRVSRWNSTVNLSSTTFVVGHWHMMWSSSPMIRVPEARQNGHTQSW